MYGASFHGKLVKLKFTIDYARFLLNSFSLVQKFDVLMCLLSSAPSASALQDGNQ